MILSVCLQWDAWICVCSHQVTHLRLHPSHQPLTPVWLFPVSVENERAHVRFITPPPGRLFLPWTPASSWLPMHACVWGGGAFVLVSSLTWKSICFYLVWFRPLQPKLHPHLIFCSPHAPPSPLTVPLHLAPLLGPVIHFISLFFSGPSTWGGWGQRARSARCCLHCLPPVWTGAYLLLLPRATLLWVLKKEGRGRIVPTEADDTVSFLAKEVLIQHCSIDFHPSPRPPHAPRVGASPAKWSSQSANLISPLFLGKTYWGALDFPRQIISSKPRL